MAEGAERSQRTPETRAPLNSEPPAAPTSIIITLDHDTTLDAQGQLLHHTAQVTSNVDSDVRQQIGDTGDGLGITATIGIESSDAWQHYAVTMTEEAYIIKHYAKAAAPTSGVTMDMYLGLCPGRKEEKRNLSKKHKRHINNNTFVKHWFPLSFYCLVLQSMTSGCHCIRNT